MLRPKKNSYKEFDNEKKFLRLKNSPPHNFSNGQSLRDFSSWSPVSCVLVTFCKRICYWAWSHQWLRHWSATIWDWTKDTQSFSASSGAISYPSVQGAGRRKPWERGCNLSKSCIDHLFCCSNVESLSSIRRHIPHTLFWMRYKSVVWRKCKTKNKTKNNNNNNDNNKCHQNWTSTMIFNFYKKKKNLL